MKKNLVKEKVRQRRWLLVELKYFLDVMMKNKVKITLNRPWAMSLIPLQINILRKMSLTIHNFTKETQW